MQYILNKICLTVEGVHEYDGVDVRVWMSIKFCKG